MIEFLFAGGIISYYLVLLSFLVKGLIKDMK